MQARVGVRTWAAGIGAATPYTHCKVRTVEEQYSPSKYALTLAMTLRAEFLRRACVTFSFVSVLMSKPTDAWRARVVVVREEPLVDDWDVLVSDDTLAAAFALKEELEDVVEVKASFS